jgi:branched-chain amino acid transport system permease protein
MAGGTTAGPGPAGSRLAAPARAVAPVALVLAIQLVLFPMPLGVWLQGLVFGLLGSLMAVGLGLVYRLNKVVNFAQGDLGTAPAVLAVGLIGLSGASYLLGLAAGLASAVVLTVIVEVLVIRRFARAPRLVLTVVTIGLSQALVVVSLLLPGLWGQAPISTAQVRPPWPMALHISPLVFNANHLIATVVSLACLGGVAVWFTRTNIGIAIRATGDRRDRAAMLGIQVGRLQTVTWVAAGLLSFISIFFKAAILGLPLDPSFSLTSLVTALAALALGGFSDLPVTAASAVALGVLSEGVAWDQPADPALGLAVVAAVVLLAVLVRQLAAGQAERAAGSGWLLVAGVRDTPAALRRLPQVRLGAPAAAAVAAAAAFSAPLWMGPGTLIDASTLVVLAIVGCSIVVLTGWSGQVTLGQMSLAALGAATGAVALLDWHWDLSLALLLAGAAGALVAVAVGVPTLRLDGIFVGVTTLALALAASGYLLDPSQFSWIPAGHLAAVRIFGVPLGSEASVFELCLAVGVLTLIALSGLRHSRTGRVLRAVQSNEHASAGYGVAVARARLSGFAISGFIAGVAGCLLLVVNQQYTLSPFTAAASLTVFTAAAVGGLGSALGAVLGAALMEGSAIFLPPAWQMLPAAIGVLIVLLAFPGGVSGLWFTARDRLLERAGRRREPPAGHDGAAAAGPDAAAGGGPDGAIDGAVMTR